MTRLRVLAGGRATDGGQTVRPVAAAPGRPHRVTAAEGQRLGVQLQGVSKWYGGLAAIRDLALEVRSGEFLTLLGPSGSGKTTTLMMVAGFATPSAGRILIDGRDVTDEPPHRRGIGVVFQSYALFPHLTVARNVAFPLEARGVARRDIAPRVRRALDLVKLGDLAERYPTQLSGGQQQRVALARAFVFEPSLLLMDEPLGALDKKLRQHMQMELIKLKSQLDVTVIYVTHDQEEALVMSDRVVVMADGVIQQIGAPADLYSRPANRFVADFIGEANILEGTLRSVGEAFQIEIPDGTVFAAAGAAVATGERVAVVVRPESVVLGPAAAACRNAFEGRVEQAIYVGDALRYVVQLPSGQSISTKLPHRAGGDAIAVGDRIRLGWDVESAWVVPCDAPLAESARP